MAANNDNSAAQPAKAHFPLAELNDASNKSGGTTLAKAVGSKAEKLNNDTVLHSLRTEDAVMFEVQGPQARDLSQEEGKETSCALLSSFARTATGIADLDSGETIWQLNWVLPSEPSPGENMKNKDGTRLWFPLTIRDISGPIVLYLSLIHI